MPSYKLINSQPKLLLKNGTYLHDDEVSGRYMRESGVFTVDSSSTEEAALLASGVIQIGIDDSPVSAADHSLIDSVPADRRKLKKWFDGGIPGKSIALSGDSTTWGFQNVFGNAAERVFRDGRIGRIQIKYPAMRDVTVYARGENGGTLAGFITNAFTDNHRNDPTAAFYSVDTFSNLSSIIALDADLYVLSWGINDVRVGTSYTSANLQADLTTAVNAIRAAVPKACIILRMPNAHATDNVGGYLTGGATAQNAMDRYQRAYRALRDTWPDVLVWDAMSGLFPNVAVATAANNNLLSADGLHPSTCGYDQILDAIFGLATPATNFRDADLRGESSRACPLFRNTTNGLVRWDPNVDPLTLLGDDWYKVYAVQFSDGARASYSRWTFLDYKGDATTAVRDNAFTSAVAAQGLVPGDIVSLQNRSGQRHTFVINSLTPTQQSTANLQYNPHPAGTWGAADTDDLVAGHPLPDSTYNGFVYRHKFAHCESMRLLQALLANPMRYDAAVGTVNPYAVARRFYISATPALGAITVQTIGSETGGDLSARTWSVTDSIIIPGITGGAKTSEYVSSMILPLTGAVFTADAPNKRMAITGVTIGGALVDFSKYVIPQGYVLSAT